MVFCHINITEKQKLFEFTINVVMVFITTM